MSDLTLPDGTKLTEPRAAEFLDGFLTCVPTGYELQADLERGLSYCKPWNWTDEHRWYNPRKTWREMGAAWARSCWDGIVYAIRYGHLR